MWLETLVLIEAAAALWLSALNLMLLGRMVTKARVTARRVATAVLMCVCGGQAMEALLFLWQGETSATNEWSAAALLLVRSALLISTALISLLLMRARCLRP